MAGAGEAPNLSEKIIALPNIFLNELETSKKKGITENEQLKVSFNMNFLDVDIFE